MSTDDVIRIEVTLNNNLDTEKKNLRISELEKEVDSLKIELERLQAFTNEHALLRLRLSRAISAIKRLGGDPSVFGL